MPTEQALGLRASPRKMVYILDQASGKAARRRECSKVSRSVFDAVLAEWRQPTKLRTNDTPAQGDALRQEGERL